MSDTSFHELLAFIQTNALGLWWLNALWACTFAVYMGASEVLADLDRRGTDRCRNQHRLLDELPMLKSADEWLQEPEFKGIVVMDPDGWDRRNFEASWGKKITRTEFEERLNESTSMRRKE